jgi:hypothetical protein
MSGLRFERHISRIQVQSISATSTRSVLSLSLSLVIQDLLYGVRFQKTLRRSKARLIEVV